MEKEEFLIKYLRKQIPGEEFSQKIRNPNYEAEMDTFKPRISQEEVDTKFRNYQKKELWSSLTLDPDKNQRY